MASLYRKYRPQRFSELVGQDHVTTALRNAVTEDRVGHAYLFSGPRGTGKTTTARLLARALNCLHLGADGEPDGTCENCVAIAEGTFYDLVELDAASNNGVEAMRELIQSVHLGLGASSRRKVYIIDEVHMLSAAASNTLLKTLEEPPPHVVFVLATTDPHKVLPTIRSRTQHFEFTLLSAEQLRDHLVDILGREGVAADAEVLDLIVRRAAGSARDALSLLDQALAVGGGALDAPAVQAALGGAPFDLRLAVLEAVATEDVAGALTGVHELLTQGHDVRRVADDLLRTMRDAFMAANAAGRVPYDGPAEEAAKLAALAQAMGNALLVRGIEILGQSIVDIRQQTVADPRLVLEVAVVRVARREARTSVETLLERVERLERQLASGGGVGGAGSGSAGGAPSPRPAAPEPAPEPASAAPASAREPVLSRRPAKEPEAAAAAPADDEAPPVAEAARARVVRPRRCHRGVADGARRVEGAAEGRGAARATDRGRARHRRVRCAPASVRRDQRTVPQRGGDDQGSVLVAARLRAPVRAPAPRLRRARRAAAGRRRGRRRRRRRARPVPPRSSTSPRTNPRST